MNRAFIILALLILASGSAFGQTKEETMAFLVNEYRSFERRDYQFTEIKFPPAGDAFSVRRNSKKHRDYALTFQLKDVEIYKVTVNHANGVNQFRLMVRTRGRDVYIGKNSHRYAGALKISPSMDNERKCMALERAFARLTTLSTGRKYLFYD
jgi:hypothetical protein